MQTQFKNGHDQTEIESDLDGEEFEQSGPAYTLDDIAQDDDDLSIIGDNVLNHVEVRRARAQEWFQCHPTWRLSTRAVIDKRGTQEVCYLLHKRLMPWSESLEQDSVPVL